MLLLVPVFWKIDKVSAIFSWDTPDFKINAMSQLLPCILVRISAIHLSWFCVFRLTIKLTGDICVSTFVSPEWISISQAIHVGV